MHHTTITLANGEYRIIQCGEHIQETPLVPGGDPHGPELICPLCHGIVHV